MKRDFTELSYEEKIESIKLIDEARLHEVMSKVERISAKDRREHKKKYEELMAKYHKLMHSS